MESQIYKSMCHSVVSYEYNKQLNIVYAFELNLESFYNLHPVLPVRHLHDAFCIEEVLALSNQYDQDYEDAGLT